MGAYRGTPLPPTRPRCADLREVAVGAKPIGILTSVTLPHENSALLQQPPYLLSLVFVPLASI